MSDSSLQVLLTGAGGQLGQELVAQCPAGVSLMATGRAELDLADPEACRRLVRERRPHWVLNAGAYTAVDRAESEPELAQAVNGAAPAALAAALGETGGRLLHVSTDFVFDGVQGSPYTPDQPLHPLGVYGASKAAGEQAVLASDLAEQGRAHVLRTSWVYGPVGRNFCLTMLRLHGEKEEIGVVADQVGCPTATPTLAAACWRLIGRAMEPPGASEPPEPPEAGAPLPAVLHWSDAGAASWYDFAVAIGELGEELGLLQRQARVKPITTADYPTPARRPSYSLLDCTASRAALGLEPIHWRAALRQVLGRLVA
ncbi:dTDP-4-dehydrorhamnose reductase [Cyanobium sp. NIES-981]|uniref:dTDP-4-dehydrorhamnose reductase n=1 Tax=Cyanobium sp. NIES-981 TaxID=1851505 RepID=UPI0007DE1285|nr:dTDP-4-dehydrorhamnose reductase [Cyanobium sp. NIES-981]SBO44035.1 dTDP-4-dehydrorhamnose reductase [Cyanobium sp. NIES-981]